MLFESLESRTLFSATAVGPSADAAATANLLAAVSSPAAPPVLIAQPASYALLGGNVNGPTDRIQDHPFVDLVKTTRGFYNLAGRLASNGAVDFAHSDSNGWPTEDFTFCAADNAEWGVSLQPGIYQMSFVGPSTTTVNIRQNEINPTAAVPAEAPLPTLSRVGFNASTHVFTYNVSVPQDALVLAFDFHHTAGQVRNIKVLQPGYSLSSYPTFRNEYLNLLRDLSPGVIRLMDWTHTNDNPQVNWSDRTKTTSATQARASAPGELQPLKGVAWEYGISLANALHADIWVNIPAQATDDYVRNLASLLLKTLDPSLKIYVEYSNEVWNAGFGQYTYNKKAAGNEVIAGGSNLNYDHLKVYPAKPYGGPNAGTWADRRYARRLKQIGDDFKSVWAGAGLASPINGRVRPILCSQFANQSRFDNMLTYISKVDGAPSKFFYGIGVAPYLDLGPDVSKDGLTTDQVVADLGADANSYLTNGAFDGAERRANQWGLKLEAYEGGIDTYGSNSIAAKAAGALDPRIQDIITGFIDTWYSKGGGLFNWFTLGGRSFNTPYGAYSIADDVTQLDEPKELAFTSVRDQMNDETLV
jgi:hypothetical protein